jgi:hypothetical protein
MHKLMCVVVSTVVMAFYWAIRIVYLHDVSMIHTRVESAHRLEEGVPGQHTWHT